jgi:4-aminobutyrate aminotransferase-like enzyme
MVASCLERGLLLGWTLHSDTLVRLAPPLNIPFDVLDEAANVILEALNEAA